MFLYTVVLLIDLTNHGWKVHGTYDTMKECQAHVVPYQTGMKGTGVCRAVTVKLPVQ
jgi:hypothetical protein